MFWRQIVWIALLISGAGVFEVEEFSDKSSFDAHDWVEGSVMIAGGDHRYYRRSAITGWELLILTRSAAGSWVVLTPSGDLAVLETSHRPTSSATPLNAVTYNALPVMNAAQTQAAIQRGVTELAAGSVTNLLPRYGSQPSPVGMMRRIGIVLLNAPSFAARSVRWSLRSPLRFGFFLAVTWLVLEFMEVSGVITWAGDVYVRLRRMWSALRIRILDANTALAEALTSLENAWEFVMEYFDPIRACLFLLAVILTYRFVQRYLLGGPATPSSSAAPFTGCESYGDIAGVASDWRPSGCFRV